MTRVYISHFVRFTIFPSISKNESIKEKDKKLNGNFWEFFELCIIGCIVGAEWYIEFFSLISYFFITFWTIIMFSSDISMLWADRECRCDRDIGKLIILYYFSDKSLTCICRELFSHIEMENCPSRIFALKLILSLERLESIISIVNGDLSRIGIVWIIISGCCLLSSRANLYVVPSAGVASRLYIFPVSSWYFLSISRIKSRISRANCFPLSVEISSFPCVKLRIASFIPLSPIVEKWFRNDRRYRYVYG